MRRRLLSLTLFLLIAAPAHAERTLVRPGDTIEFYTRFNLVPPPGRRTPMWRPPGS